MTHDWILDVLTDLRAYASKNGLTSLAAELDETALIAAAEIASVEGRSPIVVAQNARTPGVLY